MPYINSTQFGNVVIDNKKYNQVLIIGDSVMERDYQKLEELFNTSHEIGDWEIEELLKQKPEIMVIATGQSGAMKVDKEFIDEITKKGIEVITDITPKAIEIYNEKVKKGKRVNALIHTTC